GYHQSAVGHLSPFIHECRTYYLNSRLSRHRPWLAVKMAENLAYEIQQRILISAHEIGLPQTVLLNIRI
ncbi:hypothetical protein, partial [Aeromonas sp. QDB20]|uniref:hypothetical protein n=1 Tax=Aeromonas sp. QDB20 TaxID=2989835 RepID=UPI0022DFDD34